VVPKAARVRDDGQPREDLRLLAGWDLQQPRLSTRAFYNATCGPAGPHVTSCRMEHAPSGGERWFE